MSAALYWMAWYVPSMAAVLSLALVQPKTERSA